MKRKILVIFVCMLLMTITTFAALAQPVGIAEYKKSDTIITEDIEKVKKVPVPWQTWGVAPALNLVWDNITLHEEADPVWIDRDYVVLVEEIPLDNLTWEFTMGLPWTPVEDDPILLQPGEPVSLEIKNVTENDGAVLVRYEVLDELTRDITTRFVNELTIDNFVLVEVGSNFDVYNTYTEKINNFELELYGDLKPADIWYVYPGWGTGPCFAINQMSYGLEIIWKDRDNPIPPNEKRHVGVTIDPSKDHIRALGWLTIETILDATANLKVTIPRNRAFNFNFNLLSWLFEQFPNAFPILRHMLGL